MTEDVTAILVNYHGAQDICASVAAIMADTSKAAKVRIVVVDNSESDEQVAALRAGLHPSVHVLVTASNLGFGEGCNLAVRTHPAHYYWLVNPDVRVMPGCLDALLSIMKAHPKIGAASPRQSLDRAGRWLFSPSWMPGAIDTWAMAKATVDGVSRRRYAKAISSEAMRLWSATQPIRQRALSGAAMLIRHACLDPLFGLFDPQFFMYFEDVDLCRAIKRRGFALAVVPAAHAVHLWKLAGHKGALMDASAPLFFNKHFEGSRWLQKASTVRAVAPIQGIDTEPVADWTYQTDRALPQPYWSGWLLEVSPNPLLQSSVGYLGSGDTVFWPQAVVVAMQGVTTYARISPVNRCIDSGLTLRLCHRL